MGIRSFPKEGLNAEKFLRDAYIAQLTRLGGQVCTCLRQGVPPQRFNTARAGAGVGQCTPLPRATFVQLSTSQKPTPQIGHPVLTHQSTHAPTTSWIHPTHQVEKGGVIVDFGCGVGTSTRLLAEAMPDARRVIGMDLSPYMIAVGNHHNREKKIGRKVSLVYGDVADTRLPEGSASLVSCTYLLHEMPDEAVR